MNAVPGAGASRRAVLALLFPIMLVNLIGFIVPMLNLGLLSFKEALTGGGIGEKFTLANWVTLVTDDFNRELLLNSVGVSLAITVAALVLSYPIALYIQRAEGLWRSILIVLVISPLLTSAVVRTYGWVVILSDQGGLPSLLNAIGLTAPRMIFNTTGVIVGLTEILMPYMIVSLLAGFGRLDPRLEEAAATLGASPIQSFWRVVFPLTLPGVALGCLLVFVLSVSSFITPKLLGGGRVFLLATEIYDQAIVTLNWPLAATLSILVLVLFGLVLVVYGRAVAALD
ncbi:putative spermidine/putrescine transport system permease protein [Bosea sp. OK403]|uniref:ABC transporter permease n=1 Tax=Bosea sp. OK403 TaxID=1855286 RepID=UPI0008EDC7AB|nr:ABC transporter permease [Bosea sp. OK403]SFI48625.1 putative spermidine/putrescine transport system permease protein [Bosea sp. OK403]